MTYQAEHPLLRTLKSATAPFQGEIITKYMKNVMMTKKVLILFSAGFFSEYPTHE